MKTAAVVGLAIMLSLPACYKHTLTIGDGAPDGPLVRDTWEHFWIAGVIGHTEADIREICPAGDATIRVGQSFLNGLVAGLTAGIYTPTRLQVRCAAGRQAELDLEEADVERIVTDRRFRDLVAAEMPERLPEVVAAQEGTR